MDLMQVKRGGWPFLGPPNCDFELNVNSPQARGLVAWWPMLADANGHEYVANQHATPGGNKITLSGTPIRGLVPYFDGSARLTHTPLSIWQPTDAVSVSLWIRRNGEQSSWTKPFWYGDNSGAPWGPYGFEFNSASDSQIVWHVAGTAFEFRCVSDAAAIADTTWYHMVGVYASGVGGALFLNAVQSNWSVNSGDITDYDWDGVGIGDKYEAGQGFTGWITDVRIYNRALSAPEIWSMYNPATRWELYRPMVRWWVGYAAAGGTQYNQSVAGALSSSGIVARQTSKFFAGALSSSGELIKQTATSLAGAFASSGAVSTVKTKLISLAGAITPSGTVSAAARKILAGTLTTSGNVYKMTATAFAGALSFIGDVAGQFQGGAQEFYQSLYGTFTSSGELVKQTATNVAGALSTAGTVIKETAASFAGAITPSGVVNTTKVFLRSLAGAIVPSGTIVARANKALSGALAASGTIIKLTSTTLSGAFTSAGAVVKQTARSLTGAFTSSGIVLTSKVLLYNLAGAINFSGTITGQANKVMSGAITFAGSIDRLTSKTFGGTLNLSGIATKLMTLELAGGLTLAGAIATMFVGPATIVRAVWSLATYSVTWLLKGRDAAIALGGEDDVNYDRP